MTNITGKIYQQTNAAGTENRFPRTVIEAVYGLSSYLQTQFGNLANIYMPIEGITESKPLQEFVYRLCPSTIKPKSFVLDRIKGKSLAWNQLVETPSFTLDDTKRLAEVSFIAGHKYLFSSAVSRDANPGSNVDYQVYWYYVNHGVIRYSIQGLTYIVTAEYTDAVFIDGVVYPQYASTVTGSNNLVDLTLLYGSAIDGLTDAQIMEKFEAEYPGYHDYSAGKLISNDAESIETVGFNLWDEEWESGYLGYEVNNAGQPIPNASTIRTKNFIQVIAGQTYYFLYPEALTHYYWLYDANFNCIVNAAQIWGSAEIVIPENAAFMKYACEPTYGPTYNHDICINLSDSSFNGQYEPYKKSTLNLGLNSIKVYSPNIWDEEWEVGGYNTSSGAKVDYPSIRSKNRIPIKPSTTYWYVNKKTPYAIATCVLFYDANGTYLSTTNYFGNDAAGASFTTPSNAAFMTFYEYSDYGTTYGNDITFNESSPAFNGRYFPHGILTIEGGLKGAGNVYDEIVGTKHTERVYKHILTGEEEIFYNAHSDGIWYFYIQDSLIGSNSTWNNNNAIVSSALLRAFPYTNNRMFLVVPEGNCGTTDSQTATEATNAFKTWLQSNNVGIQSALATPIEYDLAEPLVLTMKAGTTEARVSPNAYGLSAPFCADITYSASENNDSASAQYALTAGRLLNSHKLWGQDFNGEQDITGPLDDVTRINNLLYLVNGNVGIGQSNPQYKLDVAGTFRATGNATIGGAASIGGSLSMSGTINGCSACADNIADVWSDGTYNHAWNGLDMRTMAAMNVYAMTLSSFYGLTLKTYLGRIHITYGGNVGIGNDNPSYKLDVDGDGRFVHSGYDVLTLKRSTNAGAAILFANTGGNLGELAVSSSNALTYSPDGSNTYNVYHSGNANRADVNWTANILHSRELRTNGDSSDSGFWRGSDWTNSLGNNDIVVGTHGGSGIITLAGYVGVRKNGSSSYALDVDGVIHSTTGIFSDGYVTAGTAQSSSDMRLKTNVRDIENALVVLKALKPREWDWNEYSAVKGHAVGFVAQEVEPWMPYAVGEIADAKLGTHKTLSYEMFNALTIAGWQNHESRIEQLERENQMLREKVQQLEMTN